MFSKLGNIGVRRGHIALGESIAGLVETEPAIDSQPKPKKLQDFMNSFVSAGGIQPRQRTASNRTSRASFLGTARPHLTSEAREHEE